MSVDNSTELQAALEVEQKKLDLVLGIDHIRDNAPDPSTMLTNIVNMLTDQFHADFCALALIEPESGEPEMKTVNDRSQQFNQLGKIITRDLVKRAIALDRVVVWKSDELQSMSPATPAHDTLQLVAVPIIMGENERLGALLLARAHAPFSNDELDLLRIAESQIDSAVIQGRAYNELQQYVKELETVYRIDRIRDQSTSFDEMLNVVLREVCTVINAEMGFTMLYNQSGQKLELRAATHDDLFRVSPYYDTVIQLANESLNKAELICNNNLSNGLQSMMCMPLILNDRIIGVLGVVNRYGPRGFSSDDRRLLHAIGSQMDTAIFENIEKRRLQQVLGRSVDPRIMKRLLANPDVDFLKGERAVLTVLYADLRGSTLLAERISPEELVGFMNHYLGQMTDIILAHEGTLDKFVGDEVMALFGAPFPQADHALRAVRVGLAMQSAHQVVMEIWRDRGIDAPPLGVGIATGELIVGEMGCPQRADYTVIGKAANLGSRICSAAKADQVLISQETYNLIKEDVEVKPINDLQLKGFERNIPAYDVMRVLD